MERRGEARVVTFLGILLARFGEWGVEGLSVFFFLPRTTVGFSLTVLNSEFMVGLDCLKSNVGLVYLEGNGYTSVFLDGLLNMVERVGFDCFESNAS